MHNVIDEQVEEEQHAYREASAWAREFEHQITEESDQFRFVVMPVWLTLKGSVGLILAKVSAIRVYSPRPIHASLHSTSWFHSFSSPPHTSRPFPSSIPSALCLSGT